MAMSDDVDVDDDDDSTVSVADSTDNGVLSVVADRDTANGIIGIIEKAFNSDDDDEIIISRRAIIAVMVWVEG